MQLAVARELAPALIEHDRGVVDRLAIALDQRAAVQHDLVPRRELLEQAVGLAAGHRLGRGALAGIVLAEIGPHLRQGDEGRALLGHRLLDQALRLREVGRLVGLRVHLDQRDLHDCPPPREARLGLRHQKS